jgi:hypothetical protein
MSLVLQSSGGGSVTLEEPVTASNYTITVPAATATMAIQGPAFSAYQSASTQSVSNDTQTKITFDAEEWDTNNNFASSRFTPTVAGYYQLNASVLAGTLGTGIVILSVYKNGSAYKRTSQIYTSGSLNVMPTCSTIVYANGSTDYFEIYYFQETSTTVTTNNNSLFTWFNGAMVRAA